MPEAKEQGAMPGKRIVILTGSELRHAFFRKFMALRPGIEVLATWCEGLEKSLGALVEKQTEANDLRKAHLKARECAERDFFQLFVEHAEDRSNPVFIPKGDINKPEHVERIVALRPDLLVAYGCSIIKGALLETFAGRFVNVHLGLSPWYRGSGTNFWPLVNDEPELVGVTFMHIDAGVDTGEIIHQIRADYCPSDTAHTVGNRLIRKMAFECAALVRNFDRLERMPQPPEPEVVRYYRKKDFIEESVKLLRENLCNGMIERYLARREQRDARFPLVRNPALETAIRD